MFASKEQGVFVIVYGWLECKCREGTAVLSAKASSAAAAAVIAATVGRKQDSNRYKRTATHDSILTEERSAVTNDGTSRYR